MPALHGRRGLKQRRKGFFGSLPAPMPGTPKGLVHLCQQCGTGFPSSGPRQQSRRRKPFRNGAEQRASQEVHLGGYAASRIGSIVEMTTRIREFLKHRTDNGPCLVVDLDVVRENYQNFAKALPDTKVFYAVKANPAPEILKLLAGLGCCFDVASLAETHDVLAAGATARPHLLRQHHQERDRDRHGLRARRHAVRRRLRGRGGEGGARGAGQPRDLPHPLRRLRRRMAAVAQVRLRAGLCRRHSRIRAQERARAVRHFVPRRLAAAQCRGLGPRARLGGVDLPHLRRARHRACHRQSRRRLPGANTCARRRSSNPTARRSSRRCASTSATTCRTPSSSPAAAWSAMPA